MEQGFVDLRAERASGVGSDSFWPSFTDIMMVVVLIFILSSVVLILRNWELVNELRASILAEQEAQEIIESTTAEKETVEEQLARVQHQLSFMRMRLMQAQERDREATRQLAEREQRIIELEANKQELSDRLASASTQNLSLQDRLERVTGELGGLQSAYSQQEARLQTTLEQLASLEQSNQEQSLELGRLRQMSAQSQQELASLQGDYESLKVEYDKLVRPARTAQGKYVVEVRYLKEGGEYKISLKEPAAAGSSAVTREGLDRRLSELKQRHGEQLYVKIIIPESSGLSYSEAWNFTQDVLNQYDYYYQ